MTTEARSPQPPLFSKNERIVAWATGICIVLMLLILLLYHQVVYAIAPGYAGVRYSLLFGGTQLDRVLPEGIALKLPWDRIYSYEVRIQQVPFAVDGLSLEGMTVRVEGNVLYRPLYEQVARLHANIGPNYEERVVTPIAIAAVRDAIAGHLSHELYTHDFEELKDEIVGLIEIHPSSQVIDFTDIAIRRVGLPTNVTQAIEQKLAQEQLAASYEFRLLAQQQEAERRRVEAIGIQTFYAIVSQSLTDALLTWRGIEATVELSKSPNTKIVVVGGGEDQMPLILGSDITKGSSEVTQVPEIAPGDQPQLPDWSELPRLFPDISTILGTGGATEIDPGHSQSEERGAAFPPGPDQPGETPRRQGP